MPGTSFIKSIGRSTPLRAGSGTISGNSYTPTTVTVISFRWKVNELASPGDSPPASSVSVAPMASWGEAKPSERTSWAPKMASVCAALAEETAGHQNLVGDAQQGRLAGDPRGQAALGLAVVADLEPAHADVRERRRHARQMRQPIDGRIVQRRGVLGFLFGRDGDVVQQREQPMGVSICRCKPSAKAIIDTSAPAAIATPRAVSVAPQRRAAEPAQGQQGDLPRPHGTASSSGSSRPSRRWIIRSATRPTISSSCVTMTTVAPNSRWILSKQRDHLGGRGAVEVPGRLVGQQQRRPMDDGPGDGHPLLLAAAELVRPVPGAVAQAHAVRSPRRPDGPARRRTCPGTSGPGPDFPGR